MLYDDLFCDVDSCPQPGNSGVHSDAYLEGEARCRYCGAEPKGDL
jgi:hypothetical protein